MRVGVLTYHRVVNLGSVIQAWCVVDIAKRMFPDAIVEIVDYRPFRTELRETRSLLSKRYPFWNRRQIGKRNSIRRFVREHLPLSAQHLVSDNAARVGQWIDSQNYDVILVGSDTVWELRRRAFSPAGVNAYFLPFETRARKISIAASMDPVPQFTSRQRSTLTERLKWIERFDLVTVRDEATRRVLLEGGIADRAIHTLPDPTLMTDWLSLVSNAPFDTSSDKPVVGVALPRDKAFDAHQKLRAAGFEVWDWNGMDGGDCDFAVPADLSVGEKLALHKHISGFITDRFHGSIFSLVLADTPVLFYEDSAKWASANSKGRDLFEKLGMSERVYRQLPDLDDPAVIDIFTSAPSGNRDAVGRIGNNGYAHFKELITRSGVGA